ncbi:MAG: hypothetical protein IT328_07805 [Caldilineaceae bacterium]|nr:hypothetical protein [Caldilineaceae bacterium]
MPKLRNAILFGSVMLLSLVAIYASLLRPWHMQWGATDAEVSMPLPGDPYIPEKAVVSTRAITIQAPRAVVWAWLVQLGQGRGGFYSYEWLENLFAADMHNADSIVPELQQIKVGDHVSFQRNGPFAVVALVDPERALVLEGGWTCVLEPVNDSTTRLIVRYASFEVNGFLSELFYYPIFEPAHFVMENGMMLGIKARAEAGQQVESAGVTKLQEDR